MQGRGREEREQLGGEDNGAVEWEKPLESSEALKRRRREKSSWFNEQHGSISV
jgi:hypothetical protein